MNSKGHPIWLAVAGIAAFFILIASAPTDGRSTSQQPAKRTGPLRGQVVLPDGKPASNVRLSLIKMSFPDAEVVVETRSDALGAFAFADPHWPAIGEPELVLAAEAQGYGLSFRWLADWTNGDKLKMAAATELHLALHQPAGEPATGVQVWPELLSYKSTERTQFLVLPSAIRARHTAKSQTGPIAIKGLPRGAEVRLAHDSPYYAKFAFDQRITLAFAPVTDAGIRQFAIGSSLSGRVTFGAAAEPVVGVHVNAQEAFDLEESKGGSGYGSALTDKDGNFTITQLSPGKYNLNVLLQGQMDRDWTSVAYDSTPLKEGEKKTGLDLKLIKGGLIVGTVKYSDGKPVYGTYVGVYGPARPRSGAWVQNCLTDKEGKYVLRVPAGANYVYLQGGPGYAPTPGIERGRDVTVEDGKEIRVDFSVPH